MRVGVFHTAYIGDVACLGLLVEALWQAGHEIVVIAKPICAELFEGDERVQSVLKVKKSSGLTKILSAYEISQQLQTLSLDTLLIPHRSLTSALIGLASGIKKRIGFKNAAGAFFYSHKQAWELSVHESVRYLTLAPDWLVPLSIQKNLTNYGRPILKSKHTLQKFSDQFPDFFRSSEPYFVVSPGSVWATKKYKISHLAEATCQLLETLPNYRCVLNGGPDDDADIHMLVEQITTNKPDFAKRVFDGSKLVSVGDMVSLLRRANFAISNDSGPTHVANAVNCPVIAIYGPTPIDTGLVPVGPVAEVLQFNKLYPSTKLNCQPCSLHGQKQCPLGHHRCMSDLPPQVVVDTVLKLIKKRDLLAAGEK